LIVGLISKRNLMAPPEPSNSSRSCQERDTP
jgi:hypothetical protein